MEGNGTVLSLIAAMAKYLKSPLVTTALAIGLLVAAWSIQSADLRTAKSDISELKVSSVKATELRKELVLLDKELEQLRKEGGVQRDQIIAQLARIESKVDKTNERIDRLVGRIK